MNNSSSTHVTITITDNIQWLISNDMVGPILNPIRLITVSIALFGFVTNVTNIIVFFKMGLNTSTNLCFFFLAVADLVSGCLIFILFFSLFIDWSRSIISRYALASRMVPQILLSTSAFGSWVTTVIALERWCCVVFPLKVKDIFTRKSVTVILLAASFYELVTCIPYFFYFRLVSVVLVYSNRTQLDLDREQRSLQVESQIRLATFSIPTVLCFSLVLVATISLIRSLGKNKKQREIMAGSRSIESGKEARVVKSVVMICSIYISGYFINAIKFFADMIYPGIHVDNPYLGNFTKLLTTISYMLQASSCSVNIFVYFRMVAHYRSTFFKLFLCSEQ